MGFLAPSPPPFDLEEWKRKPHLERLKPLVQDWGLNGFGSPTFVYLLYAVKLVVYVGRRPVRDLADAGPRRPRRTSATGGPSRSSSRSSPSGRCSGRSSASAPARCRSASASTRRSAARSTGCGRGRSGCRRGPTGCPFTEGSPAHAARRRALRGRDRRRDLPARRVRRRTPRATRPGSCRPAGIAVLLGLLGAPRPARQGLVPRRPARRSTRRCSRSASSRSSSGSSPGSSSSSSSGGAPRRRS